MASRVFDDRPATREETPLLLGLVGQSGTGKTYSALRLATGIQRVSGGDIFVVDTEARRSLHYANRFRFRHVAFGAPFSPTDYLACLEHCVVKRGAKIVIVDSMSHEHDGPGGVLESFDTEKKKLGGGDNSTWTAWERAKAPRRRLISTLLQMEAHFIFCFRAKRKLKIETGKAPEVRGILPIAGDDFIFELTMKLLLMPGSNGTPTLQSAYQAERDTIKVPEQFRGIFAVDKPPQLTEEVGQELARWAAGDAAGAGRPAASATNVAELVERYAACSDAATFRVLEKERTGVWGTLPAADRERLFPLARSTAERLRKAAEMQIAEGAAAIDVPDPSPRPPPVDTAATLDTANGATP